MEFGGSAKSIKLENDIRFEDNSGNAAGFNIPELSAKRKDDNPCQIPLNTDLRLFQTGISQLENYRPKPLPIPRTERFRFLAARKDDGTIIWTPVADGFSDRVYVTK